MVKKAGDLLKSFFSADQFEKAAKYDEFHRSWDDIAGRRISAHSSIFDIEKNIVIVRVDHPGWIQMLQLRQAYILATVQRRFPDLGIRGIAFRLFDGEKTSSLPAQTNARGLSENEKHTVGDVSSQETTPLELDGSLEKIEDPALRSALLRLQRRISEKNGS